MSSSSVQRLPYAAALDGLRAVAVIAVIGYHLDISWMQGGFLGVDLFFVISGYLITRLLLGEHEQSGRISLTAFWIRRFRRLVPPLIVVVAASVAATRWWGVPQQWAAMRGDAFASLSYVANWRFVVNDVSYFDTLLPPSPLRHIWSLAVEEQWYLVWPLVMAVVIPWATRTRRFGVAVAGISVAACLSAIWMAALVDPSDLSRVYYGTDTRAQQLLVGAVLAWATVAAPARFTAAALGRRRLLFVLVMVGFVAATVFVDDEAPWLYRGGLLGLSVAAAALVAAASVPGRDGPLGWLAVRPLVELGRRSYSLYLWHWPVIVFVGPPMGIELPSTLLILVQVVVSLALTEATYRWIETPTRHSTRAPARSLAAWAAAALATAVGASAVLVTSVSALPDIEVLRPTNVAPPPATTTAPTTVITTTETPTTVSTTPDPDVAETVEAAPSTTATATTTTTTAPPAPPRVMLLGDSTAIVLALARPEVFPAGWEATEYARLGCAITTGRPVDAGQDEPPGLYDPEGCAEWFDDWTELSGQFQPTVSVVMIGAWEVLDHMVDGRRLSFPSDEWTAHVETAIRRSVDAASAGGGQVVFLRLPCMVQSTDSLVSVQARNDPDRVAAFNAIVETVAADLPQAATLPLDDVLCPDGVPIGDVDGETIRYDGVHLTDAGTSLVWTWLIDQLRDVEPVPASAQSVSSRRPARPVPTTQQ